MSELGRARAILRAPLQWKAPMSHLKAVVMGGVDGVVTSFAVVAGASRVVDARGTVVVVGVSSLLADGVSMGVSEFLSSRSERAVSARDGDPRTLGLLCLASFVACGALPLAAFAAGGGLLAAASAAGVELLLLGGAQTARTREPLLAAAARTFALGALAGGVALGAAVAVERAREG